eukprot:c7365_g1_i1.p1 GENE.c7365_g1_i1~~c7365_g1_i1.p1  ORF type:complete len:278 (-),score=83.27 c7365_g1_i1:62-895(-)
MGEALDAQLKAIQELRAELSKTVDPKVVDEISDCKLKRFLIARKYDVAAACSMYLDDLEWRRIEKPEAITEEEIASEIAQKKFFYWGRDKEGHPIVIAKSARHFKHNRNLETCLRAIQFVIEKTNRMMCHHKSHCAIANGKFTAEQAMNGMFRDPETHIMCGERAGMVVIYDRMNFAMMKNFDHSVTTRGFPVLQLHYPEVLHKAYVTEINQVFYTIYQIVSVFLDERTKQKFAVLAGDYKPVLRQFIDEDQLLVEHGGILREEDVWELLNQGKTNS